MNDSKKRIKQESEWIKYKLETNLLKPPVLKLKVAPLLNNVRDVIKFHIKGNYKPETKFLIMRILSAVIDWNLTKNKKKIPVTDENKKNALIPLLGEKVKGKEMLGIELFNYISDYEDFVKDSDSFLRTMKELRKINKNREN